MAAFKGSNFVHDEEFSAIFPIIIFSYKSLKSLELVSL